MGSAIAGQCFGCLSHVAFSSGLMLLYLNSLGMGRSAIIGLLAGTSLATGIFTVPGAWLAERLGKKPVGFAGQVLGLAAFVVLGVSGSVPARLVTPLLIMGTFLWGIGNALFGAVWFALLRPVVPEDFRGRFFGTLRFSWTLVGLVFTAAVTLVLGPSAPRPVYQALFAVVALGLAVRFFLYARIPEIERELPRQEPSTAAFWRVLRSPGYAAFSSYVFLLVLFTHGAPAVFGLLEKKVLGFGDNVVASMGLLLMAGSLLGYIVGGRAIDRVGTRVVFVACHLGFGAVLASFLCRHYATGFVLVAHMGILNFLFGVAIAASSVALSSELLALMPTTHRALAGALHQTVLNTARGFSGIIWAGMLRLGILSEAWEFRGVRLSAYDSILLLCAVMVVFLVITLTLVPSVIRKSRLLPGA